MQNLFHPSQTTFVRLEPTRSLYWKANCCLLLFIVGAGLICLFGSSHFSCRLESFSGHPCIVCGCSRDFWNILTFRRPTCNPLSGVLFVAILCELCFRSALLVLDSKSPVLIRVDCIVHAVLAIVFVSANLYVIISAIRST